MRALLEPVELQVDVDRAAGPVALAQRGDELPVSQPDAVGVQVHRSDRPACARSMNVRMCLWMVGSPPGNIATSGSPSATMSASSNPRALLDSDRVPVRLVP